MLESNKKKIFISYRRSDSPDTVKLIYERLKKELPRWEIFYDHRSIPLGEAFPQRLREEVTTADVVLVIIGPSWLEVLQQRKDQSSMDHVREEVRLALESGHTVIPVQVVNAINLANTDLTDFPEIHALATFNAHRIRPEPDFDNDLNSLVSYLEQIGPAEGAGSILGGKYKLVRELGAGGMGIVWLAEQLQPRRLVAVKLVKPGMDSREVLARFDAERQAVAVMDHPHIAKVFDAGKATSGRPFFAMEYVKGVPITEYCDAKRLSPNERLLLFQQVCDAVQHAHQKGILHRDIKPGNVLVEEREGKPIPKVIDFGLAKALGRTLTDLSLHTAFESRVGTLEYSSPEQAAGGAIDVDTRTDIYSLGALLYELLAGEPPFSREELLRAGEIEMHRVIQEQDPLRPSVKLSSSASLPAVAVNRHLEPQRLTAVLRGDLDWIVMKALEKDRARRYPSASGLAEEIQRYLSGDPVQARPPSTGYRIRKYVNKHKGLVASIASIATLLVLGIMSTSWFGIQANVAKNDAITQKGIAETQRSIAENKSRERDEAARKAQQSEQIAVAERDKAEATLARSNYFLANARWNENRAADASELLQRIPVKHRNFEWYLDRRMYQGSDLTLYGHKSLVTSVAFSPDGTRLASGSSDNTIKLWDAMTGKEIRTLAGHRDRVTSVAFSSDGTRLVSGSYDHTIKLWDANTGAEIRTLTGHSNGVYSVAFSPDVARLASGSDDNTIKLWDAQSGGELRTFTGHQSLVYSVAFNPDSTLLASGSYDSTIKLWDLRTGAEIRTLAGHQRSVYSIAFSPDGTGLASGSNDHTIKLWDTKSGTEVRTLTGHQDWVYSVAFSPDGKCLASCSLDNTIKLWDARSGEEIRTLTGHQNWVNSVAFSPDGARLASGSSDNTVKLWDAQTGAPIRTLNGHKSFVNSVAITTDGNRLASGSSDNAIKLWSAPNAADIFTLTGHQDSVTSMAFSLDGTRLVSGSKDNTIKLWDAHTGSHIRTLNGHQSPVASVAFSPDGTRLASGSLDNTIKLWDAKTGGEIRSLTGHRDRVTSVAFSTDNTRLVSGSYDNSIKLWDVQTGAEIRTLDGHPSSVNSVAFSPDGASLASGSWDNMIKLWDAQSGTYIRTLTGHPRSVNSVAFSPDGTRLVSGSFDKTIKLWDIHTGAEIRALTGHQDSVTNLVFSSDGTRLASSSWDNSIKLWEAPKGAESRTLYGHQESVSGVAFSSDGSRLYSIGGNDEKFVWGVPSGDRLPDQEWSDDIAPKDVSPDGRWLVVPSGKMILLVDLEFKNTPDEKAYRESKARLDPAWHSKQAELAEAAIDWYAASFHRAWVMKADPEQGVVHDSLHTAYKQWRESFNPRKRGGSVNVNDGTKPNAIGSLKNESGNESIDPDLFLQPIVRKMLKLPRGPK